MKLALAGDRMTMRGTPPGTGARAGLRRLAGILIVVALHVGVVYALVTGLAQRTIEVVRAPIETRILPPDQPAPPVTPPPPPQFAPPPPLFVPPPEIRIAPPPAPKPAIAAVTTVKPAEPTPPPVLSAPPVSVPPAPREPVRVQPRLDPTRSREPEYPPTSRRLGEQGGLVVQVLVEPDGRPSDVKLIESSGFARLDQAALSGIRSSYRFVPGSIDGKPTAQWFTFRFVWKIK